MKQRLWILTSMLEFRQGKNHIPTPKPVLIFNQTGTTKDHLYYLSVESSRNKHLGRFIGFYPVGDVTYQ